MRKSITIILLSIFIIFNGVLIYNMYDEGSRFSVSIVEEENHAKIFEVKHYLKKESLFIVFFKPLKEVSKNEYYFKLKKYEDVYLTSLESPPDYMC